MEDGPHSFRTQIYSEGGWLHEFRSFILTPSHKAFEGSSKIDIETQLGYLCIKSWPDKFCNHIQRHALASTIPNVSVVLSWNPDETLKGSQQEMPNIKDTHHLSEETQQNASLVSATYSICFLLPGQHMLYIYAICSHLRKLFPLSLSNTASSLFTTFFFLNILLHPSTHPLMKLFHSEIISS